MLLFKLGRCKQIHAINESPDVHHHKSQNQGLKSRVTNTRESAG